MQIEVVDDPGEDLIEAVNYELRTFNQTSNPTFWEERSKPENQPDSLRLFAFGEVRSVIGGLFATTQFSWLRIDIVATKEDKRRQGVGRALLLRAEEIARERGCRYAFTDTMDYQAPIFWEKVGFSVAGEIDDWDSHGHRKFYFTKELD